MSNIVMNFNDNSQKEDIIKKMNELKLKCEEIITNWLGNTKQNYMELSLRLQNGLICHIFQKKQMKIMN